MSAIELKDVTKSLGGRIVVDQLNMIVPAGAVFGFIGPNGSGKTTTLRMIMRILLPDSGKLGVLGQDSARAASDRIGYLPEERGLYRQMKVRDVLSFFAALKGCRDSGPAIAAWLSRLGLSDWANHRVDALSKGMAQKVQFIAAVIARPQLALLDEPFSGLDPVSAELMRNEVLRLRQEGTTVLLSTHDLGVAEKMCDRLCMIYQGRKAFDGTLEEIQAAYSTDTARVRMEAPVPGLTGLPGVRQVVNVGRWFELLLEPNADSQRLAGRADFPRQGVPFRIGPTDTSRDFRPGHRKARERGGGPCVRFGRSPRGSTWPPSAPRHF